MAELGVDLPKAVIKRIVKQALADNQGDSAGDAAKKEVQVNKDALLAFSQATKVFISYVSAAAHDVCKENKRSTVTASDIIMALEDLEFESFLPEVKSLLEGTRFAGAQCLWPEGAYAEGACALQSI